MSSGKNSDERNPFAPPPADAPDQPWQPRLPQGGPVDGPPPGADGSSEEGRPNRPPVPPPHPWSPNWQGGGGPGWPDRQQPPQQPKFDPNDPVHRRSRYALGSGMAALFAGLSSLLELALLFGALALYWGVSALRAGAKESAPSATERPAGTDAAPSGGWPPALRSRPQVPAALGGLLTGGVALVLVLGSYAINLAYQPYFDCRNDALTSVADKSCANLAPHWLVSITDQQN
ncbi:hypothetical protein [Kitasatospora azatica]|uniref:hypothetical protein n=1 Tax=Kitasatospora azatica TaxID=58347 RepID=UPI000689CEC8|nr:hypothetical protein [Kitasatospora azatica]